ncbi:MAG: twin-arginine translocation signal domain-containing protein [Verrucomicrobiota bacterium]
MNSKTHDLSRRRFVGACCASVGTTGLLSSLAQLRPSPPGVAMGRRDDWGRAWAPRAEAEA